MKKPMMSLAAAATLSILMLPAFGGYKPGYKPMYDGSVLSERIPSHIVLGLAFAAGWVASKYVGLFGGIGAGVITYYVAGRVRFAMSYNMFLKRKLRYLEMRLIDPDKIGREEISLFLEDAKYLVQEFLFYAEQWEYKRATKVVRTLQSLKKV